VNKRPICYLLMMLGLPVADVAAFGRLFTTEQQRAELERGPSPPEQQTDDAAAARAPEAATIRMNGFVKTPARQVIWLNGGIHRPTPRQADSINPRLSASHRVIINVDDKPVALRPGQVVDLNTRQVRDVFEQRQTGAVDSAVQDGDAGND